MLGTAYLETGKNSNLVLCIVGVNKPILRGYTLEWLELGASLEDPPLYLQKWSWLSESHRLNINPRVLKFDFPTEKRPRVTVEVFYRR